MLQAGTLSTRGKILRMAHRFSSAALTHSLPVAAWEIPWHLPGLILVKRNQLCSCRASFVPPFHSPVENFQSKVCTSQCQQALTTSSYYIVMPEVLGPDRGFAGCKLPCMPDTQESAQKGDLGSGGIFTSKHNLHRHYRVPHNCHASHVNLSNAS